MKKYYVMLFSIVAFIGKGQVGINTKIPLQQLHIDAAKDNVGTTLSASMIENDVVVTKTGQLGIGTISPTAKVDIQTSTFANGLRLSDQTEGNGKILISADAQGNAYWQARLRAKVVTPSGNYTGPVNVAMGPVQRNVTLNPGRWMIFTNLLLTVVNNADWGTPNVGFLAKFCWGEVSGNTYMPSPDATFGNLIAGPYIQRYGLAKGTTIIENKSSGPKTYYLVTLVPDFWGGYNQNAQYNTLGDSFWRETSIVAFPAN